MKTCRGPCGRTLLLDEFYKHPQMADGHLNYCKTCVKTREAARRRADPGVAAKERARYHNNPYRRAYVLWRTATRKEDPRVEKARSKTKYAVRIGQLVRPTACEECGQVRRIEIAHYDYADPYHVRWLCRPCHRRWDAAIPKQKGTTFLDH